MTETLVRGKFGAPVEPAGVAAEWWERGYSCTDFSDPPGQAWRGFVHDCNELVTVVEGRLELEIEGTRVFADPGDEVFIPKAARHSVFNAHHARTRWLFGYD